MPVLKRSCSRTSFLGRYLQTETVGGVFILIILAILIIYPLIMLFLNSLGITVNSTSLSLMNYLKLFSEQQFLKALGNTLYLALGVTILTTLIGGSLAWLATRSDLPGKRLINTLVFLTFIVPSYIKAISWIELLGNNGLIKNLFEIYSLEGVILVMTLHLYPLVYMTVSNALKNSDISIEEAALLDGAGRFRVLVSVTLPLILPSILSIGLFIFARTVACFGVAAVLALPARKYILTTYIYTALNSLNLSEATTISVILVLFTGVVFFFQNFILKKQDYTTISSASSRPKEISLGKSQKFVLGIVLIFFLITTILPLIVIVLTSLLKAWGLNYQISNFTLANYREILFGQGLTIRAFRNSISFGIFSATIAVFLGSLATYLAHRSRFRGKRLIEFFASWPMAMPEIVMAVAAILAWINPPLKLYNTPWIIIVTYIAASLPFVVKNVSGLIQNIDPQLEEMAWVSGASFFKTFRQIIVPLIKPGLRTGWVLAFLFALREIPISVMLYANGTETIGVLLFNLRSDTGGLEMISALAVIVLVLTISGHLLIKTKLRSD